MNWFEWSDAFCFSFYHRLNCIHLRSQMKQKGNGKRKRVKEEENPVCHPIKYKYPGVNKHEGLCDAEQHVNFISWKTSFLHLSANKTPHGTYIQIYSVKHIHGLPSWTSDAHEKSNTKKESNLFAGNNTLAFSNRSNQGLKPNQNTLLYKQKGVIHPARGISIMWYAHNRAI